jgi:hypothetical protein
MDCLVDRRPRWLLERRWDAARPLPRKAILTGSLPPVEPLDFTARIATLTADIVARCGEFSHIDPASVLFTFTPSRTRSKYGLQARVTPMRFRDGQLTRRFRGHTYQVQRYYVDNREVLYLVTFCLPRFLDQPFGEKLTTVFHELYHIGERFDGDLRRHPGRYCMHSHSKKGYDRHMATIAKRYATGHPDPSVYGFLRGTAADIRRDGGLSGIHVPRPKLVPVGWSA